MVRQETPDCSSSSAWVHPFACRWRRSRSPKGGGVLPGERGPSSDGCLTRALSSSSGAEGVARRAPGATERAGQHRGSHGPCLLRWTTAYTTAYTTVFGASTLSRHSSAYFPPEKSQRCGQAASRPPPAIWPTGGRQAEGAERSDRAREARRDHLGSLDDTSLPAARAAHDQAQRHRPSTPACMSGIHAMSPIRRGSHQQTEMGSGACYGLALAFGI
jgi:hypothetical protein